MPERETPKAAIQVVDSHTAGEPTRVVLSGGPNLPHLPMDQIREHLRSHHDGFRTRVIAEPRGSEVVVGALLCAPINPAAAAGVVYFNDVGYLGMCGHGTIGVITTLAHLGRIQPGIHLLETPVGTVQTELHLDGTVSVENVASYRLHDKVAVEVPSYGCFFGDIAWGGNWFFLIEDHPFRLEIGNRAELLAVTTAIRAALAENGITGADGALIDHIELFGAPANPVNSSRNFVLCPGTSYDRSPCGTGTSAKMACLFAAGRLKYGEIWRQEGILGTVFSGSIQPSTSADGIIPTITGQAYITAESTLHFDPNDPFPDGIPL
jgi:4-hydroxyproline epimerase